MSILLQEYAENAMNELLGLYGYGAEGGKSGTAARTTQSQQRTNSESQAECPKNPDDRSQSPYSLSTSPVAGPTESKSLGG